MLPTLADGDWILVEDNYYTHVEPTLGDLALVEHPERLGLIMVKRIVEEQGDGFVVLGDNAEQSTDSRHFGALKRGQLKARVCSRL
jgi:nickel-type superoxide dismutase maturation protease